MGGCKGAAAAFAAACCVSAAALCSPARADPSEPGATWLFFTGTDIWRSGGFIHGGLLWSPDRLDREGFTLKAMVSGGTYRYLSGALGGAEVIGREVTAQLMPGWRFKGAHTEFKVFAGLDAQDHRLSPDDPSSGLRGQDLGLRAGFDFWAEPFVNAMLATDGMVSTVARSYSFRIAAGWRIGGFAYIGPEAQAFASDGYSQRRIGLHITALKTGDFEWSAAAGWARDSDERSSLYLRLGVLTRR